ncbi:MAG: PQQ-like beta-propeller repeat protein [Rubripirellula sp.]|nr:PQQ-like beta-propeller repeat protein [Rubripirellula sp.]
MNQRLLATAFFATLTCFNIGSCFGDDWPQWRGPDRNGKSNETGLLREWPADGPPLAWSVEGMGIGYSSIAVANGKIFTLGDLDDGSYALALNEADGALLWKTRIGEAGGHRGYPGPRSTPTVDGDQVFVLNQHSDLACLNVANGKEVWSVNLEKDFGGKMMSGWRYSESPLVDGNRVIATPGGKQGTVVALDRENGEKIWQTGDWTDTAGYSSVIIATIHGTRQYIQLTGRSVAGFDPETGNVLWRADREGKTAVITTPVIKDDIVFVTSSYGVGCNAFQISKDGDTWTTEELYANKNIANHHGGVVLLDGYVFGSSGGTFKCLDIESGELAYGGRSAGKGATTYADGHLYLRSETGPIALIEATNEDLVEKSRFDQPQRSDKRAWAHPVVANGKLYIRDQDVLLCYDISE